jgi:cell division protein FtsI (penicillin-binding protein 3)
VRPNWRFTVILSFLVIVFAGIAYRLVQLGIFERGFLLKQGDARILRNVKMPANRGMIVDRHNRPLAISTPVVSFWFDPRTFKPTEAQIKVLAQALSLSSTSIHRLIKKAKGRSFFYLKRRMPPTVVPIVQAMKLEGLSFVQEYQRYYPQGEVAAHVLGFTNIDDKGQEGLELAYDKWLGGVVGLKSVIRDRLGGVVETVAIKKKPQPGKKLRLTIDERIQYIAYTELNQTVQKYHAKAGSIVILDAKNGDILAMVNEPTYNPNNRRDVPVANFRNRAVTDLFEPGSTAKPFTVVQALLSGKYKPQTEINTHPGLMRIGGFTIRDDLDYGVVDLTGLLKKSSNIAAAKIMLSLDARSFWYLLQAIGLGQRTDSGFPGEADGIVTERDRWYASEVATLAYGYGLSVTALQLAHAYAVLAAHGLAYPVSFVKRNAKPVATRVIPQKTSDTVLHMLESVIEEGGTGTRASIPGYRVAGKTGTAYVASSGGYDKKRYASSFVGIAPVSDPRLVIAIVIHEPQEKHFGAIVAAPVFKSVMEQSLHLLNVAPDRLEKEAVLSKMDQ